MQVIHTSSAILGQLYMYCFEEAPANRSFVIITQTTRRVKELHSTLVPLLRGLYDEI